MSDTVHEPLPIDDAPIHKAVKQFHRLRWITFGALAAVLGLAIVIGGLIMLRQQQEINDLSTLVAAQHQQLVAACSFYGDLAGLPTDPVPPAKRPSRLGVSIVIHSHSAAAGLGCAHIPSLRDATKKWAVYYHIPLSESGYPAPISPP